MESPTLNSLVQQTANLFAHSGLRLELLANYYLITKRRAGSSKEGEKGSGELERCSFHCYLQKHQERIQRQFPHFSHSQVEAAGAVEFKNLPQNQKIQYLRLSLMQMEKNQKKGLQNLSISDPLEYFNYAPYFLFEPPVTTSYISQNQAEHLVTEGNQNPQKTALGEPAFHLKGTRIECLGVSERMIMDKFKMEHTEERQLADRMPCLLEVSGREGKSDNRDNNDIYKMMLSHKTSDRHERTHQKGEQSKEKSDFPTLKSLFKKLQNTS